MKKERMKTAVVGCGAISDIYLKNMTEIFPVLEVTACCAAHLENAQKKAEQYGIRACTYEEILQEKEIELVVILTPAPTHYQLIKSALLAGKHVYTEKTMTIDAKEAEELKTLAKEKGLYLGAAPDTFLGAAWQRARKAIDDGMIGEVTSFQICANRNLDFLAALFSFLRMPGGGICYDYGVYYLTALVSLLGPVDSVAAVVSNRKTVRSNQIQGTKDFGVEYTYENESQTAAILQLENGITGNFALNGDSIMCDLAQFLIYGTKGVLKLTDPNQFGGELVLISWDQEASQVREEILDNPFPYSENSRGLGPAEMAEAIRQKRKNRASSELAYHVLDVIEQMMKSNESRCFEKVKSTCEKPHPLYDNV
ncbi:MAG: Gfo/Idh/MocA family protein [Marvinbryantia sp.]|jgi:predicted dehydrogenase